MSPPPIALADATRGRLGAAGRLVAGAVAGGLVGALIFLIMVQGSFRKGYTDLDFNHVLGTMVEGGADEVGSTTEALGVIGDTAGESGFFVTVVVAIGLVALHGLVLTRLLRRHWAIQAVPLMLVTLVLVGVVYPLVAHARLDTPVGLFGVDAGAMTPVALVLSSLGFAIVASRCLSVVQRVHWWTQEEEGLEGALDSVGAIEQPTGASLELAEEGSEQRRVGP
jgi:hypothetical protein